MESILSNNKGDSSFTDLLKEITVNHKNAYGFQSGKARELPKLHGKDALRFYDRLTADGFTPSIPTSLSALRACSSLKNLRTGLRIHHELIQRNENSNIYVANTLIDMYAKCGSMSEARKVFDSLHLRNDVSWNVLILGYSDCGEAEVALAMFQRMQAEGTRPDGRSFVGALKACASSALQEEDKQLGGEVVKRIFLEKGMAIHAQAWRCGFSCNVYVTNTLVDMYGKCSSMRDARRVFDRNPNVCVVSWNALIMGYAEAGDPKQALELFSRMQEEGFRPDPRTYVGALKAIAGFAAKEEGEQFAAGDGVFKMEALNKGMFLHSSCGWCEENLFVSSSLVDMYGKCGSLIDARRMFERMVNRDVVAWTNMILGYAENGEPQTALKMFVRMVKEAGIKPDAGAYIAALKACGSLGDLQTGKRLHDEIRGEAFGATPIVATCLVDFYSKCGSMEAAREVFESMRRRDLVAWNALMGGYADHGDVEMVVEVFERMKKAKIQPDCVTFMSLLKVCSHAGLIDKGREFFEAMRESWPRVVPEIEHYSCMIDLLGRANELDEALEVLRGMPYEPNKSIWTAVLSSCQKWGNMRVGKIAFEALVRLDEKGSPAYLLMANSYEWLASLGTG